MRGLKYISGLITITLLFGLLTPLLGGAAAIGPISSDMDMGHDAGPDNMGPDHEMAKDHMNYVSDGKPWELAGEEVEGMFQESMARGLFGNFSFSEGAATGYFVSFQFDESSGTFSHYLMKDGSTELQVFDSIEFQDSDIDLIDVYGSVMIAGDDSTQIVVHDNPVGLFHVVTNDSLSISFDLAEGIQVSEEYAKVIGDYTSESVVLYSDGFSGVLMANQGDIEVGEEDVTVSITLNNGSLIFRGSPIAPHRNMHQDQMMMDAFMKGGIGGEISVMVRNGSALANAMGYQHQFHMELKEAEKNRLTFNVSSEQHEGRVVLINVDGESLELEGHEISVSIDDEEANRVYNPMDVLYSNATELNDANYMVLENNGTAQLMIYIPSFSTHTVTVESFLPGAEVFGVEGLIALIAGIAVTSIATLVLFRERG